MYNGAVMYPVGKCKLKCTRDGSSHVLEFQVVDGGVRPLFEFRNYRAFTKLFLCLFKSQRSIHGVRSGLK